MDAETARALLDALKEANIATHNDPTAARLDKAQTAAYDAYKALQKADEALDKARAAYDRASDRLAAVRTKSAEAYEAYKTSPAFIARARMESVLISVTGADDINAALQSLQAIVRSAQESAQDSAA